MKMIKLALVLIGFMGLEASAQWVERDLIPYRQGAKWGYSDAERNIKITPKYAEVGWFSNGLAPVKVGTKWGYIDRTGKLVIPARYTVAKNFRKGYMPGAEASGDSVLFAGVSLRSDGYEVCINTKGVQFKGCPAIPDLSVEQNREPVRQVQTIKNYNIPGDTTFDRIVDDYKVSDSANASTYYVAVKNNRYGVINNRFEVVVPFNYDSIRVNREAGPLYLEAKNNDLRGILSAEGSSLVDVENTTIRFVRGANDRPYAVVQRGNKFYVRDIESKSITPLGYRDVSYDNNGFVITNDEGMQGYYFLNNRIVEPKYRKVEWFENGDFLRITTNDGRVGYINTVGDEYFRE